MAVVINEFEIAPAPASAFNQAAPPAPSANGAGSDQKSASQKQQEAERVIRHHKERLARVRAH